jgi:hypothetical protein
VTPTGEETRRIEDMKVMRGESEHDESRTIEDGGEK